MTKSSPSVPPKLAWHRVNENPLAFQRQMVLCIRVEVGMTVATETKARHNEISTNIKKIIKNKGLVMCNDILRVFEKLGHPSATLCLKSEILKRTAAHMAWGIFSLHEVMEKGWNFISLWFQDVQEGFSMILLTSWDQHVQMRDKYGQITRGHRAGDQCPAGRVRGGAKDSNQFRQWQS